MRFTKRIREEAALICSLCASDVTPEGYVVDSLGSQRAVDLADEALTRAMTMNLMYGRALWAEAEALLRTGWAP